MKTWAWVAIAAIGFWVLTKYRAATSLTYRPVGVSFDGINLVMRLAVSNSSPFPISFQSFNGTISANGVPLGGVADNYPMTIAPGAETVLPLQLTPDINNIVQLVKNIFSSTQAQTLQLTGTIQAENLQVPVNTNFSTIPSLA